MFRERVLREALSTVCFLWKRKNLVFLTFNENSFDSVRGFQVQCWQGIYSVTVLTTTFLVPKIKNVPIFMTFVIDTRAIVFSHISKFRIQYYF